MATHSIANFRTLALAAAAATAIAAAPADAFAGHRHHHHHHNGGALLAAGIVGLALGAAIASPPPVYAAPVYSAPIYVEPQPRVVYVDPPVYSAPNYHVEPETYCDPRARYGKYPPHDLGPCRRPLSGYGHHAQGGPKVVTYDDADGGYLEPWSQAWLQYCRTTYRSFDARTGTYRGYDGQRHFCVAQ
jgi:hypothetical protein